MDVAQTRLYNIVVSQILRHAAIYSGESTAKLARALLLLRRVCFHAALLTFKGEKRLDYVHGLRSAAQLNSNIGSSMDLQYADSVPYDRSGMSYAPGALSVGLPSNGATYWSAGSLVPAQVGAPASMHSAGNAYHAAGLRLSATGASYRGGTFAAGPAARSNFPNEQVDLGSCKLASLRRLLVRFAGLKLAILVDSADELRLVESILNAEGVRYLTAFCADRESSGAGLADRIEEWLQSQRAVETFNLPATSSGVLLCSKHVFQPPSMHPHQADAVAVLSDDWLRCTEVKDCFRLRLLSAGPTGAPLTVVRVVAAGTIEERMARKGQSFLQLQGTPVSQLYPGLQELQTATSLPLAVGGLPRPSSGPDMQMLSELQQLLHRAPTLVLIPIVVKSLSSMSRDGSTQNFQNDGTTSVQGGDSEQVSEPSSRGSTNDFQRAPLKGPIVLGRPGTGVLARDQGSALRARSSIVSALSGLSSTDPLRQPDAQRWLSALRRDLRRAERAFEHRNESVTITAERDLVLVPAVTDLAAESGAADSVAAAGRYLLHRALGRLCSPSKRQQVAEDEQNNGVGHRVVPRVHHVHSGDDAEMEGESDEMVASTGFSQQELKSLKHSGLSRTEPERLLLGHYVLPYKVEGPSASGLEIVKVKTEADPAQKSTVHWPQSFHVFRDILPESRRNGVDIDAKLVFNPLLTATRYDTVSTRSCGARDAAGPSDISIRYLHEGSRVASNQKSSAKPRRSRPSAAASRKKETTVKVEKDGEGAMEAQPVPADAMADTASANFDIGFLSDLDPMADSPSKTAKGILATFCLFALSAD
jgi:hypothetical protein